MYVVVVDKGEDAPEFKVFGRLPDANQHANARHNDGESVVSLYKVSEEKDPRRAIWLVKTEECELVKTMPRKMSDKEQAAVKTQDMMRQLGIID